MPRPMCVASESGAAVSRRDGGRDGEKVGVGSMVSVSPTAWAEGGQDATTARNIQMAFS